MKQANDELLCLDHDPHLEKIQDLKWLPWIGIDYFNSEPRILIVGESHYLLPEDNPYYEKNKDEVNSPEKDFTRNVVQTFCIDHKKVQPMFDNLNRCLFGKRDMKKITLDMRKAKWQQLAFYNFVQRPMENNQKRPTGEDLENGWKVFAELIKILQPTECIFIGVAAADSSYNPYKCRHGKEKVGNVVPRLFSVKIEEQTCQCIAIKHTSHHFSWKKWREYLKNNNFLF